MAEQEQTKREMEEEEAKKQRIADLKARRERELMVSK
jgi:hypothetical protein